jgi:hypothetical protein
MVAVRRKDDVVEVENHPYAELCARRNLIASLIRQGFEIPPGAREFRAVCRLNHNVEPMGMLSFMAGQKHAHDQRKPRMPGGNGGRPNGVETRTENVELAIGTGRDAIGQHCEVKIHGRSLRLAGDRGQLSTAPRNTPARPQWRRGVRAGR